jgi:hypothetical protein
MSVGNSMRTGGSVGSGNQHGYTMDLTTLWTLASHWYDGRLYTPYQRRTGPEAIAYFASIGLHSPFWGQTET